MLFPVKRLPSINSADQYLVSSLQTTEVSTASSSYPLLLKYHNLEDSISYSQSFLVKQNNEDTASLHSSNSDDFYLENSQLCLYDFSTLADIHTPKTCVVMPNITQYNDHGLIGLHNLENTCFMNSIIQCLRFTKSIFVYIFRSDYLQHVGEDNHQLVKEFSNIVRNLWQSGIIPISPRPFCEAVQRFAPEFDGYTQQDAHEFLLCLLTTLHENLNVATVRQRTRLSTPDSLQANKVWQNYLSCDNSRIIEIFVGQLRSTLICTHCGNTSATFDPFWDLSLPIPSDTDGPVHIRHCLSACLNEERIDGTNKPYCNKCKSRRPCHKQMSIHKLPSVLILHLKRFTDDQEKLNTVVDFPLKSLDLSSFCSAEPASSNTCYNLYAVVNHRGSMSYGHYTAFCHNFLQNQWFEYNDHRVLPLDESNHAPSDKAYILFYELSLGQSSKL